ncbi:MAG TPA: CsgG/HfaB family protein [Longimicrobiaceae bacterium]|nr:CsgG/HfaB family protein [Longimicrobiaceae bacterium]
MPSTPYPASRAVCALLLLVSIALSGRFPAPAQSPGERAGNGYLVVLEPREWTGEGTRGLQLRAGGETVRVTGLAYHPSGIRRVLVNGTEASVTPDGSGAFRFSGQVSAETAARGVELVAYPARGEPFVKRVGGGEEASSPPPPPPPATAPGPPSTTGAEPPPAPAAGAPPSGLPTLAVFDFDDGGSIGPDAQDLSRLGAGLAVMLTTEMTKNPRVQMVERDRLRELVEEQKLAVSGMVDPATAVRVGRLLGARYVVFGSYTDLFSTLRIDARVVEVETGRLRRGQEVTDRRENLFRSVGTLATQLFRDLDLAPASPPGASPAIPARAALLFSRGIGFEDAGDTERAKDMYRQALQLFPGYEDARRRLARLGGAP